MNLELGTGMVPTPGYVHHDKFKHSPHIDLAFDLESLPWPLEDDSVENLRAFDVFEHLHGDVQRWLDECWRVVKPGGILVMRLPSWNHPLGYSWRDPTHQRVFHSESFHYWTPLGVAGTVWKNFGRYYFGENYSKWWIHRGVELDCYDLKFKLEKHIYEPEELTGVVNG